MAETSTKRAGRGRPKNEAQATRILDFAEQAFSDHGFAGMRMQALADALEVNKALLFHYFQSKQGLYDAVMDRVDSDLDALVDSVAHPDDTPHAMAHRLVDAYWSFTVQRPSFPRLLQWGYLDQLDRVARLTAGNRRRFAGLANTLAKAMGGDLARAKHGYLTLLGAMHFYWINPRTVRDVLGTDPQAEAALQSRRAHLHALVDALLDPQ